MADGDPQNDPQKDNSGGWGTGAAAGAGQYLGATMRDQGQATGANMQQYIDRLKGSPYGQDLLGRSIWPQSYMDNLAGLASGQANGPTSNLLQMLLGRQQSQMMAQGASSRNQGTGAIVQQAAQSSERAGRLAQPMMQAAHLQEQQQAQDMQAQMLLQQQQLNDDDYLKYMQNLMTAYSNQSTPNPSMMEKLGGTVSQWSGLDPTVGSLIAKKSDRVWYK